MELELIKKLIKKYEPGHIDFSMKADVGNRYYRNQTDVLFQEKKADKDGNPLRNADNRIPRNFHGLLVNQKKAYAFTSPPLFDVGNDTANKKIPEVLGDDYRKNCMQLCTDASNTSIAWVQYWEDEDGFQWSPVDSRQIIPIWSNALKKKLLGVMRTYSQLDEETGEMYRMYEYWSDTTCQTFRHSISEGLECLHEYYTVVNHQTGEVAEEYEHGFGQVPFIPFYNNDIGTSDLVNIKGLIDVYDKVFSGFINDLDDVQELIFVLSGYGGTDLNGFLQELKKYKTISLDNEEGAGLSTLNIEIPVEARNTVLDLTRKAIFEQGFGFDPQPETFGNQSGEALKFMYSNLEMKTGLMETEFQSGFAKLIRAICQYYNLPCGQIIQTWTRTSIKNDTEQAQICKDSVGIVSQKTILKNHPFVEDADTELEQLKKEEEQAREKEESYLGAFSAENRKEGSEE